MSKETYYSVESVKRDLLQCQKRPTTVSKETYYSVKRDLGVDELFAELSLTSFQGTLKGCAVVAFR